MDLLARIARRNIIHINMTITTFDEALARALEPLAPRPQLRLAAIRKLADANVRVTVLGNPVLPLITDSIENLDSVCAAAKAAGAASFSAAPVFLKSCAQQVFFPFLESRFPHSGDNPEMVKKRVQELVARHGLAPPDADYQPEEWDGAAQMDLFENPANHDF